MAEPLPASLRHTRYRRLLRYLGGAAMVVLVVLAGAAGWTYVQMRGSLAQLDGEATIPGATGAIALSLPLRNAGFRDHARDDQRERWRERPGRNPRDHLGPCRRA